MKNKKNESCNITSLAGVSRSKIENKIMNANEVLMPISIMGSFGTALYFFTKVVTDYMLKKKMIEKGYVNDDTQAIFKSHTPPAGRYGSLKWGLLALSGGIALILMEYLDVRSDSPMPYGILSVALSAGFLVYYFLVKNELKKQ